MRVREERESKSDRKRALDRARDVQMDRKRECTCISVWVCTSGKVCF